MATEIKMPQLSDTMDSGKILTWRKSEGQSVSRGDILAEVETDKANLEIEAFQPGVLIKILVAAGQTAKVGQSIAFIGQSNEKVSDPSLSSGATESTPVSVDRSVSSTAPMATQPVAQSSQPRSTSSSERIKASPLARKLAEERQVDLSAMRGSGPNGRILKKDLDELPAKQTGSVGSAFTTTPRPAPVESGADGNYFAMSKMRETIARRMQESVAESPHFYTTTSVDMAEALKLRELLKGRPEFKGVSVNHLIIKACAYGLSRERSVNRAIKNGQVFEPRSINIGIVTAIEDGLLIPVVKETDTLPLRAVVFEARAAVERARAGRPSATDLTGGTFSISNMGMFDVDSFTAIINPGQGAILAVSAVKDTPIVKDGVIVPAKIMKVTLSVDHRIIDGVMASRFLQHFKQALEHPALLFVADSADSGS